MSLQSYIHKVLPGAPGGPLLFAFHGTGGDENQLLSLARDLLPAATIVSPRGDVSEQGAGRFFRRTAEGVYDMADLERATAKMTGFVQAHAEAADVTEVYGLGYSNGANILATVLFAAPGLFRKAVLMHPLIPFEPDVKGDLAGTDILITAGRRDPICPPLVTARLDAHLRAKGGNVTLEWHDGGHELRPNEIAAAAGMLAAAGKGE